MRIILILIVIAAIFVVVQAQRHGCKYDATLLSCVFGQAEAPAPAPEPTPAPTPEPTPAPEPQAPAPETPQ